MKKQELSESDSINKLVISWKKQNLKNKKIYFDSDWTEVRIGYDQETWIGFVEIISD